MPLSYPFYSVIHSATTCVAPSACYPQNKKCVRVLSLSPNRLLLLYEVASTVRPLLQSKALLQSPRALMTLRRLRVRVVGDARLLTRARVVSILVGVYACTRDLRCAHALGSVVDIVVWLARLAASLMRA